MLESRPSRIGRAGKLCTAITCCTCDKLCYYFVSLLCSLSESPIFSYIGSLVSRLTTTRSLQYPDPYSQLCTRGTPYFATVVSRAGIPRLVFSAVHQRDPPTSQQWLAALGYLDPYSQLCTRVTPLFRNSGWQRWDTSIRILSCAPEGPSYFATVVASAGIPRPVSRAAHRGTPPLLHNDEGIGKLVSCYDKCVNQNRGYMQK